MNTRVILSPLVETTARTHDVG